MFNLDSFNFYGDYTLEDYIERNVIDFLNYGFLEVGAFYNVPTGQINWLGQDESRLRPVIAPHITGNTVYAGYNKNWVWESGISFKYSGGNQPIIPSGIYFNGVYVPYNSTVSGISYFIDFTQGSVFFGPAVANGTTVQVGHAVRAIQIESIDSYSYRNLNTYWNRAENNPSGTFNISQAHLPAIFIGLDSYGTKPQELGSRSKFASAKLHFEVFARNPTELRKICDTLYYLESKAITLYNLSRVGKPLNYRGERVSGHIDWKYNIQNYPLSTALFKDGIRVNKIRDGNLPIYRAKVFADLETVVNIVQ